MYETRVVHIEGGADARSASPAGARAPHLAARHVRGGLPTTRAAICRRVSMPSSGISATRVKVRVGPTPGTLRSRRLPAPARPDSLGAACSVRHQSPSAPGLAAPALRSIRTWTTSRACWRRLHLLGSPHPHDLPTACRPLEFESIFGGHWARLHVGGLAEVCNHLCIDPVLLHPLPRRERDGVRVTPRRTAPLWAEVSKPALPVCRRWQTPQLPTRRSWRMLGRNGQATYRTAVVHPAKASHPDPVLSIGVTEWPSLPSPLMTTCP